MPYLNLLIGGFIFRRWAGKWRTCPGQMRSWNALYPNFFYTGGRLKFQTIAVITAGNSEEMQWFFLPSLGDCGNSRRCIALVALPPTDNSGICARMVHSSGSAMRTHAAGRISEPSVSTMLQIYLAPGIAGP